MKVTKLKLRWFRGASEDVGLNSGQKSLAVYGDNGAGKSSFVDGIEYILNQGRIGHLAHEHSGRRQEKAILNTHIPKGEVGKITVTLEDNSEVAVSISPNGSFSMTPESNDIVQWGYQHTILRQNELANFITDTKGGKYSSLLPLLGLRDLEVAAENLRQLEKAIADSSELNNKKTQLEDVEKRVKEAFVEEKSFEQELDRLYKKYFGKERPPGEQGDQNKTVIDILSSLKKRIEKLSGEQKTHATLLEVSKISLSDEIESIRKSALKLSQSAEPLINERLSVLQEASIFAKSLTSGDTINCPACGSSVSVDSFQEHVKSEKEKLKEVSKHFDEYKRNIQSLCNTLHNLKRLCDKDEVSEWKQKLEIENVEYLSTLNIEGLRQSCTEKNLQDIESHLIPIISSAIEATRGAPPEIQELLNDNQAAGLISEAISSQKTSDYVTKIENLIAFIGKLQKRVREKIRVQSSSTITSISDDIARMWGILHPNEKIEDVHLYLPAEIDKAIEIGLKFYGIEQPSPRLTLSEGHRNSLGLCIFLSMAKHNLEQSPPIFLDDVVVSFDRSHRGMVAELLEKEFSDRQIILFTHDREWFIELKQLLNQNSWEFRALMPWIDPGTGIRWSEKDSTFDDARTFIETEPAAAGNTARKIMDIHLALISEKLKIKLPYLHRERNDHRMAHDFLVRIILDVPKCFQIEDGDTYKSFDSAAKVLKDADDLLIAWANRASHSFDIVKSEAQKLTEACEAALGIFTCSSCKKLVTKNIDTSAKIRQCKCGALRWRYGKS